MPAALSPIVSSTETRSVPRVDPFTSPASALSPIEVANETCAARSTVSPATPIARPIAPIRLRPGTRTTPVIASPVTVRIRRPARRGARAVGVSASAGGIRAATQAGASPAMTARKTATGSTSRARVSGTCRSRPVISRADTPTPARPAATPSVTTSPSMIVKTAGRPQPTARRAPISVRRPRTPASAALDRNNAQTTRMSTSSASDSRSACRSTSSATPVCVQASVSRSGGRPNFPAGSPIVTGYGDAPAVTITCRPVAFAISSPITPILSSFSRTVPRRPDTRTRIDPIGARVCASLPPRPWSRYPAAVSSIVAAPASVVYSSGGCWA